MVNMASSIASSLDFDVRSGLLPFDKLRNASLTVWFGTSGYPRIETAHLVP